MPKIPIYGRNRNVVSQDASVRLQNMPVGRDDTLVNALGTLAKIGEATANVFQAREQVQDDDNLSEIQLKTQKNIGELNNYMTEKYQDYDNFLQKRTEMLSKNQEEIKANMDKLSSSSRKRAEHYLTTLNNQSDLNVKNTIIKSQIQTNTDNFNRRFDYYVQLNDKENAFLQLNLAKKDGLISQEYYDYQKNVAENAFTLHAINSEIKETAIPQDIISILNAKDKDNNKYQNYPNITAKQREQLITNAHHKINENSHSLFNNLETRLINNDIPNEEEFLQKFERKEITQEDKNRAIRIIRKNQEILQQKNDDKFLTMLDNRILNGSIPKENIFARKVVNKEISDKAFNLATIKSRNAKADQQKIQEEKNKDEAEELNYLIWEKKLQNNGMLLEKDKYMFSKIIDDIYLANRQFDLAKKFKQQISENNEKIKNTYAYQYGHGYIDELDNSRFDKFEWDDDSWLNRDSENDLKLGKKYIQYRLDNFLQLKSHSTETEVKDFIDKERKILNKTNLIKVFDEATKIKVK